MAKYTTQIRSIVESGYPIFDFDYPLFDPKYKTVLEQKIIDHYYFREIGFETVGQFKHFLKSKLNMIMPLYNEHYLALEVFKTYDPYVNKDITTTETRTTEQDSTGKTDSESKTKNKITGSTTGESNETTDNREVFSDTPQAKLQGLDYATNLTDQDGTTKNTSEGSTEQDMTDDVTGSTIAEGSVKTTDEYIQTIKGFDGMKYASDVYMGVRETIINIDEMVVEELNDLFMNIY